MAQSATEKVLLFAEARRIVEEQARFLLPHEPAVEAVALSRARGRVLAESICADRDLPPFSRAARDGFAVIATDVTEASESSPIELKVVGEIAAGAAELPAVHSGEAAAIMTGAAAPVSADAIVMVEYTRPSGKKRVQILRPVRGGENIVPQGAEARAGDVLLAKRQRMGSAAIAVAASVGKSELRVYRQPRVAILATGDELVAVDRKPGPHQIRNSNSWSLASQVEAAGGEPAVLPAAPDEADRLAELIGEGLKSDLLLLAGGVSMGSYDLVKPALGKFDAEFFFTGALIQPGRPIVFGRAAGKYFFGLPGNPVSTLVTFELFVRPLLEALGGAEPQPLHYLRATLKSDITTKTGLARFLPARLSGELENTEVELVRWQGSGDVVATAAANCYIVIPPDRDHIARGELVSVLPAR